MLQVMGLLGPLDLGLRILTAVWPLLAEVIALLFWSSKLTASTTLQALLGIAALFILVLAPAGRLATRIRYLACFVLLAHSAWALAGQVESESGIQTGTVINAVFAVIWLGFIALRARLGK